LGDVARLLLRALDETIAGGVGRESSERAVSQELLCRIARGGAMPLFLVFSSGERTALGHPEPDDRPLSPGALWRTDFGARLPGGLIADVARTGVVGEASPDQI